MKNLLCAFLILFFANGVNAVSFKNLVKYDNCIKLISNETMNLNSIERQIFNQTFEYDLPQTRIERLETKMFGTCQSGSLQSRYNVLKNASRNYRAYNPNYYRNYSQYHPPMFTGTSGSNWKNMIFGNFMNQFAGMPTGYTPTLTPSMDPAYADWFEAERTMMGNGEDKYYRDNYGYHSTRVNRGSKTGVTILD